LGKIAVPRADVAQIHLNIAMTHNKLKDYEATLNSGLSALDIETYLRKHNE